MRRRRVILATIAGFALIAACQRDRVLQTFDGPVKVENVQYYAAAGYCDCTPRAHGTPRLVVHDDVKYEIVSYCTNPTVKQHGAKKLIALYCPTTYGPDFEEWRIFRRLGGGRYIEDCKSKGAAAPDLDAVKPIAEVASTIMGCTYGLQKSGDSVGNEYMAKRYRLLAEELSKAGGPESIARFLEQTIDEPLLYGQSNEDGWINEAGRLEPGARAALLARVCGALERGDSSDTAYVRAARMCALDSDEVKSAALARFVRGRTNQTRESTYDAWEWSLAIAARGRPKEAGAHLCSLASKPYVDYATKVFVGLRATGVKCPGAAGAFANNSCRDSPDAGCEPIDDAIEKWGFEVKSATPRPEAIRFPDQHPVACAMKREYDAGTCQPAYDAGDAADASARRDR